MNDTIVDRILDLTNHKALGFFFLSLGAGHGIKNSMNSEIIKLIT